MQKKYRRTGILSVSCMIHDFSESCLRNPCGKDSRRDGIGNDPSQCVAPSVSNGESQCSNKACTQTDAKSFALGGGRGGFLVHWWDV